MEFGAGDSPHGATQFCGRMSDESCQRVGQVGSIGRFVDILHNHRPVNSASSRSQPPADNIGIVTEGRKELRQFRGFWYQVFVEIVRDSGHRTRIVAYGGLCGCGRGIPVCFEALERGRLVGFGSVSRPFQNRSTAVFLPNGVRHAKSCGGCGRSESV
jgi:hypothetical protein